MRILHVTQVYAGGVREAINTIAQVLPDDEHHLLSLGDNSVAADAFRFATATAHNVGHLRAIPAVRREIERVRPDVVHAHSSWAGFYTRALPLDVPNIYEPHAFKFADWHQSRLKRTVFHLAERVLAPRTTAFATLSNAEDRDVARLAPTKPRHRLLNFSRLQKASEKTRSSDMTVAMIGRLAPQKDPSYFVDTVAALRESTAVNATWIGGGEEHYENLLREQRIEVTGWLGTDELAAALENVDLYLHVAHFEGFPISVLDAAAAGLPMLARNIEAFDGTPIERFDSPAELAAAALRWRNDPDYAARLNAITAELAATFTQDASAAALRAMYAATVAAAGRAR